MRHGDQSAVDLDVWLGDDPDLALVTADMGVWDDAHPCECEAICRCPGLPTSVGETEPA